MSDHITDNRAAPDGAAPHPHDQDQFEAWSLFEMRLMAFLSTLGDRRLQRFTLHVPTVSGTETTLNVGIFGRCEMMVVRSNVAKTFGFSRSDLDQPAPGRYSTIAHAVSEAARSTGLPHPGLMTVTLGPGCRGSLAVLGLAGMGVDGASAFEIAKGDPPDFTWIDSPFTLRSLVERTLQSLGHAFEAGSQGGFGVTVNEQRLWVQVADDQPSVALLAPVVCEVESKSRTDRELNRLNRRTTWTHWVRLGRRVRLEHLILARPFVPDTFAKHLVMFADAAAMSRAELPERLNGTAVV
ncbi:T3SS (YopN, CesT) and YbjN peptide-binding chaperone 1 [Propionibacteriaceae bacterium Y1700]|uniref:T3SS (YopN, CesT) and YbjN peptide-binding chaperone 1 n=1 Tax=Microlunatus sp. Y1700 TaxID=3418487 RepID=UPI003DA70AB8